MAARGFMGLVFNPLSLSPVVWYDPSDLSTLFQDSAGTIAGAVGMPVGLMLDKSQGLVLGPELVTNGDFDSATGWTVEAGWEISAGKLRAVSGANGTRGYQQLTTSAGTWYKVTFDVDAVSGTFAAQARAAAIGGTLLAEKSSLTTGLGQSFVFMATGAVTFISFIDFGASAVFDNVSAKALPGNHASQATSTKRPLLQNIAYPLVDFDQLDDVLNATLPQVYADSTVGYSVPGIGYEITTGQSVGTALPVDKDNHQLVIVPRALTPDETYDLAKWLAEKAGVTPPAFISRYTYSTPPTGTVPTAGQLIHSDNVINKWNISRTDLDGKVITGDFLENGDTMVINGVTYTLEAEQFFTDYIALTIEPTTQQPDGTYSVAVYT